MTRRELIAVVPFAGVRPGIIDAHTHFYDPSRPQGVPWPGRHERRLYRTVLPPEFRRLNAAFGVAGTVVIEASPWLEDNQWLLDLAKREPVILGVVGNLDPAGREFRDHLRRFTSDRLFRGIRVHGDRLREKACFDGLERLAGEDLSLDLLGGPDMLGDVARLAARYPNLRIILDHVPFEGAESLADWPNVFAKVSGALSRETYKADLDKLASAFGPERLIYGSNWPVSDINPHLSLVSSCFRDDARFFRTNCRRAYKLT